MVVPRLECKDLHRSFVIKGQTRHVLRGVTLAVAPGETAVITGRSGQGKTVLLWLLSGIDRPDAGEVFFEGASLNQLGAQALAELRRRRIGLVFQNFNLIETWTAVENVQAALLNSGIPAGEQRDRSAGMLRQLGLSEHLDHLPCQMSIGQQQRVALARALICQPSLLIADEPSGEVDPETTAQVIALLRDHVKSHTASMVVATHGPFPTEATDRIYRLTDGLLAST